MDKDKFFEDFSKLCEELRWEKSLYCVLDLNTTLCVTFFELNRVSDELNHYFLKLFEEDSRYIAVESTENFFLPFLILGIWKSNRAFMGIGTQYSSKEILKCLNTLGIKFLITDKDESLFLSHDFEILSVFYVQRKKFYLLKRKSKTEGKGKQNMCYGIMTSGSTGIPKVIQVPWSCILLNIEELMEVLCVTSSDCLFQFSPCSFDPFFIEFFFMLLKGCSMMIVSNAIKLCPSDLLQILFEEDTNNNCYSKTKLICRNSNQSNCFLIDENYTRRRPITIMQMTPSAFLRWNDIDIKEIILSEKTLLKHLILGGEKFPTKILKMRNNNNKTKIFNIYGITEVSCWAFINEIMNESIIKPVSLGKPLKYIIYKINDKSELLIGSSKRICFIDGDSDSDSGNNDINFDQENHLKKLVFRNTNDIVEIRENELYFKNRSNQIIKKFGVKINLEKIQEAFLSINPAFSSCICIFDDHTKKLGLFYVINSSNCMQFKLQSLKNFLECGYVYPYEKLRDIDKPDFLIEIPKIPINAHGKCKQSKLFEHLKEIQNNVQFNMDLKTNFHNVWNEVLGLKNSAFNSLGFSELGGNSVLALQVINRLEDLGLKIPANFIVRILKGDTEENCLKYLMDNITDKKFFPSKKPKLNEDNFIKLSVKWKFDFGKCIDATPCCFKYQGCDRLVVGSHSSKLSCITLNDGNEVWTINLSDRIESGLAVTSEGSLGIVGCYDTFAYCLSMINGTITWKFKTGDIIKSTPCLSRDEKIVFVASYDKCLYCLSVENGCALKRFTVSKKGIYSSGIIGGSELGTFFLASLDGSCLALSQASLEIDWTKKLKNPVFASPCLLSDNEILFIEVTGIIHCLNTSKGFTIWTYSVKGCIYSTPVSCLTEGIINIFFGCNDSSLYCLSVDDKPLLKWKQELDSSVFSRPCLFNLFGNDCLMVCAATTKGFIYVCNILSGKIYTEIKLNGEVFSSPVVCQTRLYVGSRDNNLYALEIFSLEKSSN